MVFNSVLFIFIFLPVILLIYYRIPERCHTARNVVLALASLFFYAWGNPIYVLPLLFSAAANYYLGLEIAGRREAERYHEARSSLIFAIVINLLMLGFFRYAGFLFHNLSALFRTELPFKELALPLGIAFYTLQAISYVTDVYRGEDPEYGLLNYFVYMAMFPKIIAGPIVRHKDIRQRLTSRKADRSALGAGICRFTAGLFKKVVLADSAGALWTGISAREPSELSALTAWVGIIAFAFKIYFDFSGYTDMALGIGQMFGFRLPENFDHPFRARSVSEFWRRWHITLYDWFRDYVYAPLGGNRYGAGRQIRNILLVWLLAGLWHGPSWRFVVWGLYFGVILILEKFVWGGFLKRLPSWIRRIYTLFVTLVGWGFFAGSSLLYSLGYVRAMFGGGANDGGGAYYLRTNLILFIILTIASVTGGRRLKDRILARGNRGRALVTAGYILLFLISLAYLLTGPYQPFYYAFL